MSDESTRTSHGGPGAERAPGAPGAPSRVGGYRILRAIGEGGMGTVYEAEQENPRRVVALKVIRPGVVTERLLRRFEQESQLLARLQHPGIAQVFEAGTADSGHGPQPFFAMELVRGLPLDRHADQARLDLAGRLELLARVCDAVEHAHRKAIVHRDLKPANILVDEAGQPKILDFGVARATDSDLQATMHTEVGAFVGTLPYMSPEQVGADATQLDTRSDVYALGVILYELVAGRLPYDLERKTLPEMVRIIREEDPGPLSIVSRTLRGDVETIAAKALSKERERRYQSAAELAADIRRHLKHEPIVARPPSAAYQLRKFAARNRGLVGAVAAVIVVLAAGVAVSSWQAVRARGEAAKAAAVNGFLKEMLSSVDPSNMKGLDVTVRQVLDEAADRLGAGSLAGEPAIEASVRDTLGMTYRSLGLMDKAEAQLRAALEAQRQASGRDDAAVATGLNNLALVVQAKGDLVAAEPLFREALDIWRDTDGGASARVAIALNNVGWLHHLKGEPQEAEPPLRESLEIRRRLHGPRSPEVAVVLDNLASVLLEQGGEAEAEPLYREALAIRREAEGGEHPNVILSLDNLAELLRSRGDLDGAEPLYRESLAIGRKVLGDAHPDVAVTLNNLALVLRARGDLDGAEPLMRESLAIRRKSIGDDNPGVGASLTNLGSLLLDKGDPAAAEPLLREAVATQAKTLPPRHPDRAWGLSGLGLCLIRKGRHAEAEPLLAEALSIREEKLPPKHWLLPATESLLGEALAGQREFERAEPLVLRGYEGIKNVPAVPAMRKREAQERVTRLYEAWGRAEQAAAWSAAAASDAR